MSSTIDNSVDNLKKEVEFLQNQFISINNLYDYIKKNLDLKKKQLLKTCPHTSKERRREDGLYGERYWYCPDCNLEF